ncbi:glycoside hydrolase family 12 protein [Flagelloscypha sp. PMI_526]|nr:glycoside hydrolase family 12 protein [Flagelloscypha sp. PMI_526]
MFKLLTLFFLATVAFAAPSSLQNLERRLGRVSLYSIFLLLPHVCVRSDTNVYCGQWDNVVAPPYTLYLNQWGKDGATSGSACAQLVTLSGSNVAWRTTWNWTGGTGVKSYTNINVNANLNKQVSAISSIPVTWNWSQTSVGTIIANVAFDLFTSSSSGGSAAYEIMIWLANYNAGPISYTYGSDGTPTAVASNISLGGKTWNLYYGSNGSNLVYSFLPTSGIITSFSADIKIFFTYLVNNRGFPSSQYLTTLQGGTEATTGSATLTTSLMSMVIN